MLRSAGAARAIVFGSWARGEADGYSDLDLVVVMDTGRPRLDRGRKLAAQLDAGRARQTVKSSGYVVDTLEAAIWSVARTADFRGAVLLAANLADDADTVAAVTGQLAGALYGLSSIPERWLDQVAWKDRLLDTAQRLLTEPVAQPA